jgi:hypothetical protein
MAADPTADKVVPEHDTLKYSLLGPSLTKSGQDNVDQQKASLSFNAHNSNADTLAGLRDYL